MYENASTHVSRDSWNKRTLVPEALTSFGRMDGVIFWRFGPFSWEHRILGMYASVLVEGPLSSGLRALSMSSVYSRYYARTLASTMIEAI